MCIYVNIIVWIATRLYIKPYYSLWIADLVFYFCNDILKTVEQLTIKYMKTKIIIVALIIFIAGAIGLATKFFPEAKVEYQKVTETKEVIVDPYQERVDALIASTTKEWEEKHRNWAEQEVTKQMIAENEQKLKDLRQKQLSF